MAERIDWDTDYVLIDWNSDSGDIIVLQNYEMWNELSLGDISEFDDQYELCATIAENEYGYCAEAFNTYEGGMADYKERDSDLEDDDRPIQLVDCVCECCKNNNLPTIGGVDADFDYMLGCVHTKTTVHFMPYNPIVVNKLYGIENSCWIVECACCKSTYVSEYQITCGETRDMFGAKYFDHLCTDCIKMCECPLDCDFNSLEADHYLLWSQIELDPSILAEVL